MIKKIKHFLERDSDITYHDEFHYIYTTLKETIKILASKYL
jgi:hypothetical protein